MSAEGIQSGAGIPACHRRSGILPLGVWARAWQARLLWMLVLAIAASFPSRAAAENSNYAAGVAAFQKKNFPDAREKFLAVVESDRQVSGDLFFNLGNTVFRLDRPGEAALWYRRALLLNPTDQAARQNLRLLRRRAGFLEFEPDGLIWFAGLTKHTHWRIMLLSSLWLGAVCLAALIFLTPGRRSKVWWWSGFAVSVAGAIFGAIGTWGRLQDDRLHRRAVITANGTSALAAPTDTAAVIIDLPPGSEVSLRQERDLWAYAELPGDRVGWVKKESLTRLWPYSVELVE
jgi:tetratricopeptide (TPR) repeat protein